MKHFKATILCCAAILLAAQSGQAQLPGGGRTGVNAAMLKLFGDVGGFTSKADIRFQEKGTPEPLTMTVDFSMLGGRARMDLDMATVKSKQLPPEALAAFKVAGLDRFSTVVVPERKMTLLICPSMQGYTEIPMPKDEAADLDRKHTIEKKLIGRETVDGHSCEKMKVTISAEGGGKHEATVWYAADLKDFPVKIQVDDQQTSLLFQHRSVKLAKPEAKLFEVPSGFAKHASAEQLMQSAMMKSIGAR